MTTDVSNDRLEDLPWYLQGFDAKEFRSNVGWARFWHRTAKSALPYAKKAATVAYPYVAGAAGAALPYLVNAAGAALAHPYVFPIAQMGYTAASLGYHFSGLGRETETPPLETEERFVDAEAEPFNYDENFEPIFNRDFINAFLDEDEQF